MARGGQPASYRDDVAENVSQSKPSDRTKFEFPYLREFVTAADALKLPDHVEVYCHVSWWSGGVLRLSTLASDRDLTDDEPAITPTTSVTPPSTSTARTSVSQDATGPEVTGRRWGRKYTARVLTLGDVRSLIARVDEVGLRTDGYLAEGLIRYGVEVKALRVARSGGLFVREISAVPFP
jgi:hypothetical protein